MPAVWLAILLIAKWSRAPAFTSKELLMPVLPDAMSFAVRVTADDDFVMFTVPVHEPPEKPVVTVALTEPVESVSLNGPP